MRIAGVTHESIVDGPGLRFVVFAQGCPHRCPGCHNPETWNPGGGEEWSVRDLFRIIRRSPDKVKGLTLSGGEPFLQAGQMAELASLAHRHGMDVTVYTGYVWEDLQEMAETDPDIANLLQETDLLVDGPYVEALKDIGLRFRGSVNQRLIDLKASRAEGKTVFLNV
ncbi:MAG: anaerobic ribonucleoside-triphosphate reductase activating protein [Clostridiales bacterium]|nr:anaerobic ribonucleoside-triphosphate reductase activating protein [Clostridiales bacterium]